MKIYLELLVIFAILFIFIIWIIWYKFTERRLIGKYKPENDRGRKGIIANEKNGTGKPGITEPIINIDGSEQHEGYYVIPKANTIDVGKDSNSNRKIRFRKR